MELGGLASGWCMRVCIHVCVCVGVGVCVYCQKLLPCGGGPGCAVFSAVCYFLINYLVNCLVN